MSAVGSDLNLDLQQQRAEIDRAQAETRKFAAEQNKLAAEAAKPGRDRWLSPLAVVFSGLAALGGLVAAVNSFWHIGGHP